MNIHDPKAIPLLVILWCKSQAPYNSKTQKHQAQPPQNHRNGFCFLEKPSGRAPLVEPSLRPHPMTYLVKSCWTYTLFFSLYFYAQAQSKQSRNGGHPERQHTCRKQPNQASTEFSTHYKRVYATATKNHHWKHNRQY